MTENPLFMKLNTFDVFSGLPEEDIPGIVELLAYLELSPLDCLTVRDLLQLAELQSDTALFALLALMFSLVADGSLCLDVSAENLASKLEPGCGEQTARQLADTFRRQLQNGRYASLVSVDNAGYRPLVLERRTEGELLYFQRFFIHEKRLERRMETFLKEDRPADAEQLDGIVDRLFSLPLCLRHSAGGKPLERDPRQVDALKHCLNSRFSIISGGPGTGKTSLMVNLVRALIRSGTAAGRILLGAPTGRAAQRMSEALQQYLTTVQEPDNHDRALLALSGSTLHKMLGYRPAANDFRYNAANPLPAEAILLDEVSMVDVVMMDRFLQAVDAQTTRLIFLGDKDQLPSVEAGAIFARMIPRGGRRHRFRDRMVMLEKVYRSGRQLVDLAGALNSGKVPGRKPVSLEKALQMPGDSWCRVSYEGQHCWQRDLTRWLQVQYFQKLSGGDPTFRETVIEAAGQKGRELIRSQAGKALLTFLFKRVDGCRILSLVRRGPLGCDPINRRLAAEMSMAVEGGVAVPKELFSGAVVLITRNDYGRSLFNGDVGIAIRDDGGLCRVYFKRAGDFIGFSQEQLPAWEFGYAVTVHKSQGSEFDDVLLVLPAEENHRLLSREIIYTGVTRARQRVFIYASKRVLERALDRRIERTSGLTW